MSKITPHLNLLDRALKKHDVALKRTALLEVMADAFGYRNSHQLTAAAGRGDLPIPPKKSTSAQAIPLIANSSIAWRDINIEAPPKTGQKILLWLGAPYSRAAIAGWYKP